MMETGVHNKFELGLDKTLANYVPLSPLRFLEYSAEVFPGRLAEVHGSTRYSYREFYARCRRLASALSLRGVGVGDTVALLATNVPAALEAHFGVPMIGAVVNPINTRLEPGTVAYILRHAEAKVLLSDREFSPIVKEALRQLEVPPLVIDIDDPMAASQGELLGETSYERFLEEGRPDFAWRLPEDEWEALALSYTSGTTGDPKGVVYHHRGAYLAGFAHLATWEMGMHPTYLWTLPMFHSFGWCFPWTITLLAGTHVFLRKVEPAAIFRLIAEHGVTHMCAAPVVLNMLINSKPEERVPLPHVVRVNTAGSSPPAKVIEKLEAMGFEVIHTYGLTEVFGPCTYCAWQDEWIELSGDKRAEMKARQGVAYPSVAGLIVADPKTLKPVPADGITLGEILVRSNAVLKGYLKDREATAKAFAGGWFHTGDLAVRHADGYIEIRDRSKDIIISGGENISSIEVEKMLYKHPAVMEAAVVARHDDSWGEVPCAFVTLREGHAATEDDLIQFCRDRMAHFKCPKKVIFGPLSKTSTGKIQKFLLRERANAE